MRSRCLIFVILLAIAPAQIVSNPADSPDPPKLDPTVDFSGKWENQRGSLMELQMDGSGKLTGRYTTFVGGPGGDPFTRPLLGQAQGDQLVFYVDWSPYSITAWVGQLLSTYEGNEVLETVWINTVNIKENEPKDGWSGVRNGGDSFERVKKKTKK